MILVTHDQLGDAMRLSRRVSVYSRDGDELTLEARGIILSFDQDTISVLDDQHGVYNFIRPNVELRLIPKARRLK